jgi:hypothetical protein
VIEAMKSALAILALAALASSSPAAGQASEPMPVPAANHDQASAVAPSRPSQEDPGSVSGTVIDQSGAVVVGAHVRLTGEPSLSKEMLTDKDGQFSFRDLTPGPFQISITSVGLATQTSSGVLHPGEIYIAPPITLQIATAVTEVRVGVSPVDVAEEEIKIEEKQRVLGVIPNFYVSYIPDAAPLTVKQKFELAGKTAVDPFTFVVVGGAAGVEQAQNHFAGYGQGTQGYAKRFGAGYADTVLGTFIGGALFPSLLRQDPRYFYKGTGSTPSRFLYAIGSAVICKGDNGRWQPNYSNILGNLAAGGLSNLYYPEQDRNGAGLTLENGAIGIGTTAIDSLFQEFIVRKLTPKHLKHNSSKP